MGSTVCALGGLCAPGTDAVVGVYHTWLDELRLLFLVVQHKENVLPALIDRESITHATLQVTCAFITGPSSLDDATTVIYNPIKVHAVALRIFHVAGPPWARTGPSRETGFRT